MGLFSRNTVWGRKSVFNMTDAEWTTAMQERERSHNRFYLAMLLIACLITAAIKLLTTP